MTTNLTPEEIAEQTNATTAYHIRQLCAQRKVAHTRGAKRRITFTPAQVQALLDYLTEHPEAALVDHPDAPTPLSRRRLRRVS